MSKILEYKEIYSNTLGTERLYRNRLNSISVQERPSREMRKKDPRIYAEWKQKRQALVELIHQEQQKRKGR